MIRIMIADDHLLFCETLSALLQAEAGFSVTGHCTNTTRLLEMICVSNPDIVLMDININPFNGIETTEKLKKLSGAKVIGLSMHTSACYVKRMFRAGACGYLTKNTSTEEIFMAIREVSAGNKYMCTEAKARLAAEQLEINQNHPDISVLTEREIEIADLVRKGLSSKEIGAAIAISDKTVAVHRTHILKKLKLKNSSSLVNFIYSGNGLFF